MGFVVGILNLPAAGCLVDGRTHGGGDRVGVHDDPASGVPGGAADGLNEAGLAAQEALLVRVQNGHQTDLRQIKAFSQQVDAHQHVEFSHPHVPDDLHPLHRADVRVHVAHLDTRLLQVYRQVLRHLLGQGRHQNTLVSGGAGVDLPDQIVDLPLNGTHLHLRVQQSGGTDDLLHRLAGTGALIIAGSGGDVNHLIDLLIEFRKVQGAVVVSRGQTEAVIHQRVLPAPVSGIHGAALGQGHVALVDKHEIVLGEIVQQRGGRRPRRPPLNYTGIVLDAVAEADLRQHFQVIGRPLGDALGFDELVVGAEEGHLIVALPLNFHHCPLQFFLGSNVMAGGIDGHVVNIPLRNAGNGVDLADPVHLVPEKFHPDGTSRPVGGIDFQRVPPKAELVPGEVQIVPLIADFRQLFQHIVQGVLLPHPQGNDHALIIDGVAQTVQAADRGDHDHVPPLKQR